MIVTERANHAFDVMASTADKDLKMYDGIVAVVSKRSLHFYFLPPRWINIRSSYIIVDQLVNHKYCSFSTLHFSYKDGIAPEAFLLI